ncbi:MAG: hypothetical protein IPO86_00260 [Saprospiraceae bacterium]|nr:hypothetical protein [Saprospiraceae bacterium]
MVEKHKLFADFEMLTYTPEMLREEWKKSIEYFKSKVKGGWANESIINLVRYIISKEYDDKFFPGSSLGRLLISKPKDGILNYQQTLTISTDQETNKIKFEYSDWDTIEDKKDFEKSIIWSCECLDSQLQEKFEEFISWNKNW